MTFRGQEEQLRAKNEQLEEELEQTQEELRAERERVAQIAEAARRAQDTKLQEEASREKWQLDRDREARNRKRTENLSSLLGALVFVALLGVGALGVWAFIKEGHQVIQDQRQESIEQHQAALANLRAHTPDGVSAQDWAWCVDHCARYGTHDGVASSEGVVTDTFVDYRGEIPVGLVDLEGPWLNQEGSEHLTIVPSLEEMDSTAPFQPGQIVRVSVHFGDHNTTTYTYQRIHRPEE